MNTKRIIDVLKRAKHEHYWEREGLNSCPATSHVPGPCDCGAAEINSEIDELILVLTAEEVL